MKILVALGIVSLVTVFLLMPGKSSAAKGPVVTDKVNIELK